MPNSKIDDRYDFNPEKWVISLINTKGGIGGILAGHAKIVVEGQRSRVSPDHFQTAPELCIAEFHIYDEGGAIATDNSLIPQFMRNTRSTYAVLTSCRYEIKMLETLAWEAVLTPEVGEFLIRQAEHSLEYKVLGDGVTHIGIINDSDLSQDYAPGTIIQSIQDHGLESMKYALLNVTATKGHTHPTHQDDVFKTGYKASREEQYAEATSKSWFVTPDAAMVMIHDILDEKHGGGDYMAQEKNFQYAGMWCFYSYRGGHNCTTWAEEKLGKAGVGNGIILMDSSKAMPSAHVTCSII